MSPSSPAEPRRADAAGRLFVYGTLRSDSGHPAHGLLARLATLVGPGSVPGRLLDLGPYPGAVPDPGGTRVRGELWRLTNPATALAELDEYEGCGTADTPPSDFRRAVVDTLLDSGSSQGSWIYWYEGPRRGRPIDSGDWRLRGSPAPPGR